MVEPCWSQKKVVTEEKERKKRVFLLVFSTSSQVSFFTVHKKEKCVTKCSCMTSFGSLDLISCQVCSDMSKKSLLLILLQWNVSGFVPYFFVNFITLCPSVVGFCWSKIILFMTIVSCLVKLISNNIFFSIFFFIM